MEKVVVASNNAGKVTEFQAVLSDLVAISIPKNFSELDNFDVEEVGTTYHENAALKAVGFSKIVQLPCVSDDSGLEVTALDNQPGLHSKRFFPGSDDDRNAQILKLLENKEDRSAHFVCVIALVIPAGTELFAASLSAQDSYAAPDSQPGSVTFKTTDSHMTAYFQARVPGTISEESISGQGFAYDKIFIPDGYEKTYSQLGTEVKNKISHRGQALALVRDFLLKIQN
jgi:XTP/dITP diphosphohydrolase